MFRTAVRSISTSSRKSLTVGLIPADGIGREVIPSAKDAIIAVKVRAAGTQIHRPPCWMGNIHADGICPSPRYCPVGPTVFHKFRVFHAALYRTLKEECDCALFGSVSSPSRKVAGYSSPIVALRKELDLYANIRPVFSVAGTGAEAPRTRPADLIVVRENTECLVRIHTRHCFSVQQTRLYSTLKRRTSSKPKKEKEARATRLITERASSRIGKIAFELAKARPRKLLTIIHKSNVLSVTDGLFRESVRAVPALSNGKFDDVTIEEQLVDSAVYRLFREPEIFDVMVAPNLYGDIISDAAAALVGSLGVIPSINAGDDFVMGEPVHGSAPDIAGKGIANPVASIRSAALMLRHLGYASPADKIDKAVNDTLAPAKLLTPDLGGTASTTEVTEHIMGLIKEQYK
ncbi:Iso-dh domain-containing protein [Mycena venus]|uniref:Iso-dh domain-containing protein n=1 Tax=Mycena venus TaxID=2733690 RepID=A0A8H6Y2T1_9AGAR|nr:Iso-dh domain-containing protein [Mycena venus]